MENKRQGIKDDKQLLDQFLQRTIASMFEIPSLGKNNFSSNKFALEAEIDKHLGARITPLDKDDLFKQFDKVITRIQDFSVVGDSFKF